MASAVTPAEYDANGDSFNGDHGGGETVGLDAEGYAPTYGEAFPPLPVSAAPVGQKLSQSTWAAQTQAIRSTTITQVGLCVARWRWYGRFVSALCA